MKIKVEFDINVDLKTLKKLYGKEAMKKYYYENPTTHFREIKDILEDRFKEEFTSIDITSLEISKGYFKNGEYIFDEAIFTDIL